MKVTELELEQLRHIGTRRQLAQLSAQVVERESETVLDAIRRRLKVRGNFTIAADGTVTVTEQ